ncbi:4-hydroxy-tetrahydrodipicolinate synthase [hydrothermal vent metagenome]|uniref:4-hydroxy-tetrahydrodipicolinate synthase n=1 Tax=hydrothermal vent metagenome TaxID=652676 RepID=A0A3B0Z8W1_9ZZZZ
MFHGSLVALVTPMSDGGAVDSVALERLVNFHVDKGTDAIVAVGTTGESATLSATEHCDVIKQVVEYAQGRVPIIAGTGSNSTTEAIDLTRCAMTAGADACLLVAPYYIKPTQEGIYLHHKAIAEAVPIPQILYNVPGRTVCDIQPETIARLAKISNIIGVKEATGDLSRISRILELCGDQMDIYSGDDATAMEAILLGAKGDISVTANVAPQQMHDLCKAALAGDRNKAEKINTQLIELHELLFVEANPIPVKWAVSEMGLIAKDIRLPLTLLSEGYRETLRDALKKAEII